MRASVNLANTLLQSAVARSGHDAVRSIAHAYRTFADDYPGQYASTLLVPAERDDELRAAQDAIVSVIQRVLESCGLSAAEAAHHASAVRSAVHGFVALEATDSLTSDLDVDESYERLIALVIRGLPLPDSLA